MTGERERVWQAAFARLLAQIVALPQRRRHDCQAVRVHAAAAHLTATRVATHPVAVLCATITATWRRAAALYLRKLIPARLCRVCVKSSGTTTTRRSRSTFLFARTAPGRVWALCSFATIESSAQASTVPPKGSRTALMAAVFDVEIACSTRLPGSMRWRTRV